tara:strand:- start:1303 stop:1728 length:426 start_codon:yes stop_codon:yes gene_type:complete
MTFRGNYTSKSARSLGYRSGFEVKIAKQLNDLKVKYTYESLKVKYTKPVKHSYYKPDFILFNKIIIEAKGLFSSKDRQKHLLIKEQHPELDIRFVFSNSKLKLNKKSKTTYAMWCEKYGFDYADERIPKNWLYDKKDRIKR